MLPQKCPEWEYAYHPKIDLLYQFQANLLSELRKGKLDTLEVAKDTRHQHLSFFRKLTPAQCLYYAGNYRGSQRHNCLKDYEVRVGKMIGTPAHEVAEVMSNFEETIQAFVDTLDKAHEPESQLPIEDKIKFTVQSACELFIEFGKIHPYANGNGHMQRIIVWALLGRYDYWPERWGIHPRPKTQPEYNVLIQEYELGNTTPFTDFILSCIEL